jgi:hypothetical protein
MNKDQLIQLLSEHNINLQIISFENPSADDCFIVQQTTHGWLVYYQERGEKYDEKHFVYENELYDYLAVKIVKSKIIAMDKAKTWSNLTQSQKDLFINAGITTTDGKIIQ